jgi:hypothetical protein
VLLRGFAWLPVDTLSASDIIGKAMFTTRGRAHTCERFNVLVECGF